MIPAVYHSEPALTRGTTYLLLPTLMTLKRVLAFETNIDKDKNQYFKVSVARTFTLRERL